MENSVSLKISSLFVISILMFSCNSREFPPEILLSETSRTNMVSNLSETSLEDKNIIYCPTLLYAWNEIRKTLENDIHIPDSTSELFRLNQNNNYKDALKKDELKLKTIVTENTISCEASFEKSLPFKTKFNKNKTLKFNNKSIKAFGYSGSNDQISSQINSLFHNDSDGFAVQLQPKDEEVEIILYSPIKKEIISLAQSYEDFKKKREFHLRLKHSEKPKKEHNFYKSDVLIVPNLSFNFLNRFLEIENEKFFSKNQEYEVIECNQSIAFLMDNEGAKVKSRAFSSTEAKSAMPMSQSQKYFIFDQPFLLIVKYKRSKDPFLVCWIGNIDFMSLK